MFFKIHNAYRIVVAIADSDLIGKTFEEGNFQLEVKENFYKGEEASEKEIFDLIKEYSMEDATFNIVGEEAVNTALKSGIISKQGIKKIGGIPFSLVLV